ncbi:MAG: ribonuclease H family protein [Bacillota bacterium]|nr:ribonuclease H family protein [Bacillota bacterium]
MKVYAIKKGFNFDTNEEVTDKIVSTWAECLKYVKGVKGAKYKSFENLEEAKAFLSEKKTLLRKGEDEYPLDTMHAYVDGSYNDGLGKYSYAVVIVEGNVIIHIENGAAKDDSQKDIRQIAGELRAAIRAVEYAASNDRKKIVLFHDYEGICHHATGFWDRKDDSSKEYYEKINKLIKENNIEVIFVKVDSHTGDLFNEVADEEAKSAAGIRVNGVVEKWLNNKTIKVKNEDVKNKLLEIVSIGESDNIQVISENSKRVDRKDGINSILKQISILDDIEAKKYISSLQDEMKNSIILKLVRKQQ